MFIIQTLTMILMLIIMFTQQLCTIDIDTVCLM